MHGQLNYSSKYSTVHYVSFLLEGTRNAKNVQPYYGDFI